MDPFFFDPGYTLYAATGFSLWPGSRLLVEALTTTTTTTTTRNNAEETVVPSLPPLLQQVRASLRAHRDEKEKLSSLRILELGAGIGMVGTCLAVAYPSAHVCLTDLSTLVEHGVQPNLQRNGLSYTTSTTADCHRITTAVLDWTKPVPDALKRQSWNVIVASDCLLLQRLYRNALDTVQALMSSSSSSSSPNNDAGTTQFFFTFQRRGRNAQYTTLEQVLDEIQQHRPHWHCECVAWRTVALGRDGDEMDSRNELFLFRVTQRQEQQQE